MSAKPEFAEKIMSLTLTDFHRGIRTLAPDLIVSGGQTEAEIPHGKATASVRYEPLDGNTLGGLLALPRARVTISSDGLDETQRKEFLARFDRAFQRGGG